jgi:rhodanese-related sulfurtransferase
MKKQRLKFMPVLLILLIGVAGSVASADRATVRELAPAQFKAMLDRRGVDAGLVLLDTRTPKEFRQGHIEGALLLDFHAGDFRDRLKALDRNKTYLIYCRSGNRSAKTLAMLDPLGFRNAYHLRSGLIGWARENYPLVK